MISLRYHSISLAAVFLALAVGVLLGASGISDVLLSAVSTERDDLNRRVQELTEERDELDAIARGSDEFARRVGPATVRGVLADRSVVLVSTADADPTDRDAIAELLDAAGARITGEVSLTAAVEDQARADQLRELTAALLPAGARLPTTTDTGSLLGGLFGSVVLTAEQPPVPQRDREAVLTGLAEAGFVRPGRAPDPADLVLVLTGGARGGADAPDAAAVVARMAAELDRVGGGVVLAGRTGSASVTGAVGVVRADPGVTRAVSTVDDVQRAAGRVATVLALREQVTGAAGRYGSDRDAVDGPSPVP